MKLFMQKLQRFRIVGVLLILLMASLLTACSAIVLGYRNADLLAYYWADKFVDFSEPQKVFFKTHLDAQLRWHRQVELPRYVTFLEHVAAQAPNDASPEMYCKNIDDLRAFMQASLKHLVPDLAALALQLTPAQLTHMRTAMDKSNRDWVKKHMPSNYEKQRQIHAEEIVDQYATYYGRLSDAQIAFITDKARHSPWDALLWLNERKRRQHDLLVLLQELQGADLATAQKKIELFLMHFDTPTQATEKQWMESVRLNSCTMNAAIHHQMTAKQRSHVREKLLGYATDFRALSKQHTSAALNPVMH